MNNPLPLTNYTDLNSRNIARHESLMEAVSVIQTTQQGAWEGNMESSSPSNNNTNNNTNNNNNNNMSSFGTRAHIHPPHTIENSPLDNFNLLGVVTTPTSMMDVSARNSRSSATPTSSRHGSTNNPIDETTTTNPNDASLTASLTSPEYLTSTLPTTLSHSLDSWNTSLNSYTCNLLGSHYLLNDTIGDALGGALDFRGSELGYEDVPVHQLETLPDEIVNLNLETVETHLRTSGALA